MAMITTYILRQMAMEANAKAVLFFGTENAASLAASTPAGGNEIDRVPVWPDIQERGGFGMDQFGDAGFGYSSMGYGFGAGEFGYGEFGIADIPRLQLTRRYLPTDKCATLPVGVKIADEAGNLSAAVETVVQLEEVPDGVTDLAATATANPNEAQLTWTPSPDIVPP